MEKKIYNGSKVIELFYYFNRLCYRHEGKKYSFCKLLEKQANATRPTIYKFLDMLEIYGALEKSNGDDYYSVNKKNLKKALLSYPECQMAYKFIDDMLTIAVDTDNVFTS